MFERLKEKYLLGYVRKDQLERYVTLGILTEDQLNEILAQ